MEKKILDMTCGGRSIWFNKHHPAAVYCRAEAAVRPSQRETEPDFLGMLYEVGGDGDAE